MMNADEAASTHPQATDSRLSWGNCPNAGGFEVADRYDAERDLKRWHDFRRQFEALEVLPRPHLRRAGTA